MKKKSMAGLLAVVLTLSVLPLAGCGGATEESRLVGCWEATGVYRSTGEPYGGTELSDLELFSDNTASWQKNALVWKAENGTILFMNPRGGFSYKYELDGNNLTLANETGFRWTFVKR